MSKWNRPMRVYKTAPEDSLTEAQKVARQAPLIRTRAERNAARERIVARRRAEASSG